MKLKKAHITLWVLVLLCGSLKVKAQDYPWVSNNNIMVEARAHYSVFWHHHFEMQRFNAFYPAFEASIYQNTFGRNEWETLYNYPYIGVTFYHANYGLNFQNDPHIGEVLGSVFALYPFVNYPLIGSENSQLTFKLGVGLGFLTKRFDPIENNYNYAIGSHFNAAVNLSFEYRQRLTKRLMSVASVGLTHFSNGATVLPNYGLNTFSGAWGLAYYLRTPRVNLTLSKRPEYYPFEFDNKRWFSIDLAYGIGFKDVSKLYGGSATHFRVHEFSSYFMVPFSLRSSVGLGFTLALDLSDQRRPNHYVDDEGHIHVIVDIRDNDGHLIGKDDRIVRPIQMTKPNLSVCYSLSMTRLSYLFEFGWHLRVFEVTDLSKGNIYQKVSLRYQLSDNLFTQLALTTHFGQADYLCFGLGYRFNEKYYLNLFRHENSTKRLPPGVRKRHPGLL